MRVLQWHSPVCVCGGGVGVCASGRKEREQRGRRTQKTIPCFSVYGRDRDHGR